MDQSDEYPARAYFDTEALVSNGWPQLSPEFRILLSDAKLLHIACLVPDPVLRELEQRWVRDLRADLGSAKRISKRLAGVGTSTVPQPEEAVCLDAYRAHVAALISDNGLFTCPMTLRPASELFDYSVRRALTFTNDKDTGFQDAIILLSALDHCDPELPAVVISADSAFSNASTTDHLSQGGKRLRVLPSISALQIELSNYLQAKQALLTKLDSLRITNAILERFAEVREFVNAHAILSPLLLRRSDVQIRAFNSIAIEPFGEDAVQVNWIDKAAPEAVVTIAVTIPAVLDLTVAWQRPYFPPLLGVGDAQQNPSLEELTEALGRKESREQWRGRVILEARTTSADDAFKAITFIDAPVIGLHRIEDDRSGD